MSDTELLECFVVELEQLCRKYGAAIEVDAITLGSALEQSCMIGECV